MMDFRTLVLLAGVISLVGCRMSDKEYALRKLQLENQSSYPTTFQVLEAQGPITIEIGEGGIARVSAPNQPFREIPIPDGVKSQTDLVKHLISIGAISVVGWHSLDKAGGTHKKTTINNNGGNAQ